VLLFAVWRSPHRNDLIAYGGLVATVELLGGQHHH
jgi:hypothetical protein